jgi:hypothetical protein
MNRGVLASLTLAVAFVPAPAVRAEGKTVWIHIRVEEPGKDSKVSVNVPMAVAQAALAMAPESVVSGGRIHLGSRHRDQDLSLADLRRAWKELRAAGNTEIVSVEDKDETVKIGRVGDTVRIHVDSREKGESVRIEVPSAAVDALLSAEGENLNLRGALAEISRLRGDVVKVDDRDSKVRIWIDEGI